MNMLAVPRVPRCHSEPRRRSRNPLRPGDERSTGRGSRADARDDTLDCNPHDIMNILALPGLDGTGKLLAPFAARCGARVVSYPPDRELTLDQYVSLVEADRDTLLVAESFSGPVAIRIAARQELAGLVLVGSFVTPPLPRIMRALPLTTMTRLQVPDWVLSFWMLSPYATPEGVRDFREAIGEVRPRVLASRLRLALGVDERETLARTRMPLLDLRGTRDRLVSKGARKSIVQARPDAVIADVEAPHALLYTRPAEGWSAIATCLLSGGVSML
jgi:pimeloyl-ACP methyl ester carboxylesterase